MKIYTKNITKNAIEKKIYMR